MRPSPAGAAASLSAPREAVLASLIESRAMCAGISGAAVLHIALTKAGLIGWPCPVRHALGIPCPGCGLGRAAALLLTGHPGEAMRVHAFAPLLLLGVGLLALGAVLPRRARDRLAHRVATVERWLPLAAMVLGGTIAYWLGRFLLDSGQFFQLVQ